LVPEQLDTPKLKRLQAQVDAAGATLGPDRLGGSLGQLGPGRIGIIARRPDGTDGIVRGRWEGEAAKCGRTWNVMEHMEIGGSIDQWICIAISCHIIDHIIR